MPRETNPYSADSMPLAAPKSGPGDVNLGRRDEVEILRAIRSRHPHRAARSDMLNLLLVLVVFLAVFGLLLYLGISRLVDDDSVQATVTPGFWLVTLGG